MTEEIKQQLSALLDGELDPDARRFLLRRLHNDPELAGHWERWHLVRSCLRGETPLPVRHDFAGRVAAALDLRPAAAARGTLLRWAGGMAVAASVAVTALLAVPGTGPAPGADPAPAVASQVVPSPLGERDLRPNLAPAVRTVAVSDGRPLAPMLRSDPRLEGYLMRHNAALMQAGQDSFLPFIHVVSPPRQWSMLPPAASPPPTDDAEQPH